MSTSVSIPRKAARRTKSAFRPTHPRVAHVEGLVEALVALRDDRDLLHAASKAIAGIGCARYRLEAELRGGDLSKNDFLDAFGDLDRLERRVTDKLESRGLHLHTRAIPEVERCYRDAEYA